MQNTSCELPDGNPPSKEIEEILRECRKIAVVGLSPKESRDSNKVARYLMEQGYEVIPVNPGQKEILGKTCYKSLADIPFQIDMADLFLNPTRVPQIVDQAIEIGVNTIWMQLGVVHNEAALKAKESGIQVVMDRCIMVEHEKLGREAIP
ncbi:MAG: CoA-binding protein [Deltaproteobacteria bacterium]|uniref:CoA-binding protein n=1 Tax=Candidatus Desulfacyla euxinica TaxID=2841693 RepID=A0A8J6MXY2_9DELT|nr:CoA-binding protein [Candidatus Desulfacyla euxinica]MBL7216916.1 CoA-binding protein [Desulfobacteraceae bacterium]